MKTLKNGRTWYCFFGLILVASIAGWPFLRPALVHAQNPTLSPWQFGVNNVTHASCTVVASTTQFCFASDGLWQSINGAAYVQVASATVTGSAPIVVSGNNVSCPSCVSGSVVTSFGNPARTGAVTLTKADVTQTGLAAAVPASTAPLQ